LIVPEAGIVGCWKQIYCFFYGNTQYPKKLWPLRVLATPNSNTNKNYKGG